MNWLAVIVAGLFEVAWAVGLKHTEGFTKLVPTALTFAGMIISFGLLSWSLKTLEIGTAYAVWTGIGAAGTVIVGIMFFEEPSSILRLVCLSMIIIGIVGLKIFSTANT